MKCVWIFTKENPHNYNCALVSSLCLLNLRLKQLLSKSWPPIYLHDLTANSVRPICTVPYCTSRIRLSNACAWPKAVSGLVRPEAEAPVKRRSADETFNKRQRGTKLHLTVDIDSKDIGLPKQRRPNSQNFKLSPPLRLKTLHNVHARELPHNRHKHRRHPFP